MRESDDDPTHSCSLCEEPDTPEMVQCDQCLSWTHFNCANVTSDIENHDWLCLNCTEAAAVKTNATRNENAPTTVNAVTNDNAPTMNATIIEKAPKTVNATNLNSNRTTNSNVTATNSNVTANAKRIKNANITTTSKGDTNANVSTNANLIASVRNFRDECNDNISTKSSSRRVALALKRLDEERKLQAQRDNEYLNKKYELLEQIDSDEESLNDEHADRFEYGNLKKTAEWAKGTTMKLNDSIGLNIPSTSVNLDSRNKTFSCSQYPPPRNVNFHPTTAHRNQNSRTHCSADDSKFSYAPHNTSSNRSMYHDQQPNAVVLNSMNIAARQVTSKELPVFDGNPEDWPIFFANFETSTTTCNYSNAENLIRLQRSLKGRALDAVRSRLLLPESVPHIINTLKRLFGRPELILHYMLQKLRNEPAPKQDKLDSIINFSLAVENICATMVASRLMDHLSNPLLLQELVDKLPANLKLQWGVAKQQMQYHTLIEFTEWLSEISNAASEVTMVFHTASDVKSSKQSNKRPHNNGAFHNTHAVNATTEIQLSKKCCICEGSCDAVENCSQFKSMPLKIRWDTIKKYHLCRKCLRNHGPTRCNLNRVCGKNNCTFKHHPLLHNNKKDAILSTPQVTPATTLMHNFIQKEQQIKAKKILFRIVPVSLISTTARVDTFAFLDDGSSVTLIEEEVANQLGLIGTPSPLCLKWTADEHRYEENSCKVSFNIIGTHPQAKQLQIPVAHTVTSLSLPTQSVNAEELVRIYPYLKNIPLASYENAVPRLLIGLNDWKLGVPLRIKEGKDPEPIAAKTRLGWTVCGPTETDDISWTPNKTFPNMQMCECYHESDNEVHQLIKNYFTFDSLGISTRVYNNESDEDQRARKIMESTVRYTNGRYGIGLLWRYDDVQLPNNFAHAMKRLLCLEKRLQREPEMKLNITEQINSYLRKKYISKLTDNPHECNDARTWYLPIFPVINKNKPGKIRIVWDAASKVNDICLNSVLLKGPDLLASLPGVLMRFRERRYAVSGDIQEMFHQIGVRKEDRNSQRFLWRNNTNDKPDIYVMNVLTFGASCSPCCSQFIKYHHSQKFSNSHPRAVLAIVRNHYVDDLLDSVDSETEAVELIENVKMIHESGGFFMRNWISNSELVTSKFSKIENEIKKNLNFEKSTEKVLGMWWCVKTDTFIFSFANNTSNNEWIAGDKRPTKRELLRILMSIFDPLGLIANYLVYLKILLQDVWKSAIGWDEYINDNLYLRWSKWTALICQIEEISIPRCYLSGMAFSNVEDVQLHIFVDASEKAYATVAFLRVQQYDVVECSLVGVKTRVSLIKPTSVPRLELQAALLGARFSKYLKSELSIRITRVVFWSDSKTVICWLRSTTRRYKQFVSFRIGEILEISNINQWRWIPSSLNVADDGTKWGASASFDIQSRWYTGPPFLRQPENQWPQNLPNELATDEEAFQNFHHHHTISKHSSLIEFSRFSNWSRLQRKGIGQSNYTKFSNEEYREAEVKLYRQAQIDEFMSEILQLNQISTLNLKKSVERQSKIYRLTPYLDNEGLLRVGGRINAAQGVDEYFKEPIIMPRHHNITKLILSHYHRLYFHANQETVVNEIRQKFSIPQLRVAIKSIIRNCQFCKNFRARPQPPLMGEMPPARLTSFTRPFSFVGVDYFGPMNVAVGRRIEKRWIMLITCMSIRAVHLEVAHTLTTDSCILAFRNFAARRGQPLEIHSDNGTNFHGMNNELKSEWANVDQNRITAQFTTSQTKWIFTPPGSPHMGGSLERLVQSVKKVLNMMNPSRTPGDELLKSMLCEIENIVNSRPLTYIPIEDENSEALTPNHFLLGSSNGAKPLGEFSDEKMVLRKNWMISQQMTNFFWRRWVREYLPTLTRRTKWFEAVKPIQEGDIVIIVDEKSPRNTWIKGKVLKTNPNKDGQVRSATIQTQNGIYNRPTVKLAVLDLGTKTE